MSMHDNEPPEGLTGTLKDTVPFHIEKFFGAYIMLEVTKYVYPSDRQRALITNCLLTFLLIKQALGFICGSKTH